MSNSILIITLRKNDQSDGRNSDKHIKQDTSLHSLLSVIKSSAQPYPEYGDILYDQPNNKSLCQKIETVQYNTALVITSTTKGTSQTKIYNESQLESLKFRRWFRKLCLFFKIKKLFKMIPQRSHRCNTWSSEDFTTFYYRIDLFQYCYFP